MQCKHTANYINYKQFNFNKKITIQVHELNYRLETDYIQETGISSYIKIALFRLHHKTASYISCDNIDYCFFRGMSSIR